MKAFIRSKILLMSALMTGAFLFMGIPAYATEFDKLLMAAFSSGIETASDDSLKVEGAWLQGDTLHVIVGDMTTGESNTFELDLIKYAKPSDEYISLRATDSDGRMSESFRFKNPLYVSADNMSDIPVMNNLTPEGAGTVIDNAGSDEGKEFFTFETPEGNVFYLIVDRHRHDRNVYLLNAVTEYDLSLLAEKGDGQNVSAIPEYITGTPRGTEETETADNEDTDTVPVEAKRGNDSGLMIFLVVALLVGGGAGYYFKIMKPKQNGGAYDDVEDEDYEDDSDDETDETDGDDEYVDEDFADVDEEKFLGDEAETEEK